MRSLSVVYRVALTLTSSFGGSGTTANTLICLLWAVLSNADIKSRLEAELRGVEDSSETGLLPYATTSKLPYLNAVLNETLRRYPGIIGSQQRIATVDTVVAGVPVPKNVRPSSSLLRW